MNDMLKDEQFSLALKSFDIAEYKSDIDHLIEERENNVSLAFSLGNILSDKAHVLSYFSETPLSLGTVDEAVRRIDASLWQRCMEITHLMKILPGDRKSQWNEKIEKLEAPPFTHDLVYATINSLAELEDRFMAERIDGVFRKLSKTHLTNCPEGFYKRMIFRNVCTNFEYRFFDYSMVNYITDLRVIVSHAFERSPDYAAFSATTDRILKKACDNYGSWTSFDGNALRIKVFKNGNAHFEVHPTIAYQLNIALHKLYPHAIPSSFREKPVKEPKEFKYIERPISSHVLKALSNLRTGLKANPIKNDFSKDYVRDELTVLSMPLDSLIKKELDAVMYSIGGVNHDSGNYPAYKFDYDPWDVIKEILTTGLVPDDVSYQYYPTPDEIAEYVVQVANIRHGMSVLEPSAGTGALLAKLPDNIDLTVVAIELSSARAKALSEKYKTICGDFLASNYGAYYDRIVMNPPFADKRADLHVAHALQHLAPGGILVAVVPMSFKHELATTLKTFNNAFDKTGISVKVVKIER